MPLISSKYQFRLLEQERDKCLQSCLLMAVAALGYRSVSRAEMDRLTRFPGDGIGTWPYHAAVELTRLGFEVVIHECFDLEQFSSAPQSYLRSMYPGRLGDDEASSADLPNVVTDAERARISNDVKRITAVPEISDLRRYLDQGFLVLCNVTYHVLLGQPFESMHWVLVHNCSDANVSFITPHLEKTTARCVPLKTFEAIWSYPTATTRSVLAVRMAHSSPGDQTGRS